MEWGLQRISSQEISEWIEYYKLEPFGEERADLRAGIVASTTANASRDRRKRRKPFKPNEFMPRFGTEEPEAQSWERQLQIVEMLNAAFGGKDSRKDANGAKQFLTTWDKDTKGTM